MPLPCFKSTPIFYPGEMRTNEALAFNIYTLLLFAGSISPDTLGRGLLVDDWLRLRGWARIGVLVSRLRKLLDDVIARAVDAGDGGSGGIAGGEVAAREVIEVVGKLVELDGLDA